MTPPTPQQQASRARGLVHLGELSAARQALLSGPLAPGTEHTLAELHNPDRRPQQPYHEPDPAITNFEPDDPLHIQRHLLISLLRRTRRGAAPGPSGLTEEALRFVLDDEEATTRFVQVAECLARGTPISYTKEKGASKVIR